MGLAIIALALFSYNQFNDLQGGAPTKQPGSGDKGRAQKPDKKDKEPIGPSDGKPDLSGEMINVKDEGAIGDGEENDTEALQSAIDSARDGEVKKVYVPKGVYRITESLRLYDDIAVIGDGRNKTVIKMDEEEQDGIFIGEADDVYIGYLQIRDIVNPGRPESWGIHVTSGQGVVIEHVKIVNSDDAGIRLGYEHSENSKNCKVVNSEVIGTKEGSGIEVINSENAVIKNNYVSGCLQHGIRLCGAIRSTVTGNVVTKNDNGISIQGFTSDGDLRQRVREFKVANNWIVDNRETGINMFNSARNGRIVDNHIEFTHDNEAKGIFVYIAGDEDDGSRNVEISKNTIANAARNIVVKGDHDSLSVTGNKVTYLSNGRYILKRLINKR